MTEPRHLNLVDRLRGQYHLPVNDGAGPLNDSMTFSRAFKTPPIQHEAAAEIERLREALQDICDAWDSDDGGRLKGNITKAHMAGRAALSQDKRHDD